jgi:hypothetical protein
MVKQRNKPALTVDPNTKAPNGSPGIDGNGQGKIEKIATRAYQLWLDRGGPHGSPEEDWLHAEQELQTGEVSGVD